ncbi:MAG: ABC transporter permease [Haliangiales bacterium]
MILREIYTVLIALAVALLAGSAMILLVGQSPFEVYKLLIVRTWGDPYGLGQVIFKSTPLIFTGLSVALAFRVGLFNIGGEGQMICGSFAAAVCGAVLPTGTPWLVAIPLCLIAAMAAGGALGAIPGVLRAHFGAHEVINTIMLNFIAAAVVLWLGNEFFFLHATTHTSEIIAGAQLSPFGPVADSGSAANSSFYMALLAALLVHLFLQKTRTGFEWRAVGLNPRAAENGGITVSRAIIGGMSVAGALAGLVGANYVLGYKLYFEEGIGRGVGFMGIAVALLGRNHPLGIIAAALLFGTLSQGGMAVSELVPRELVDILQAVIILTVAGASAWMQRTFARRRDG